MKKYLYLLSASLMLLAVSCQKEDHNNNNKISVPEAIDLGITVNGKTVKWASFNIGASKPWEYGNYYAWGECKPKADYSWETYAYSNDNRLTKYCWTDKASYWDMTAKPDGPDGVSELYPSDDVAHVKLGDKWRMPTPDDIQALLNLETKAGAKDSDYKWEWAYTVDEKGNEAKDSQGNVIYGIRITRKSTNAVLFLPASGYELDTDLCEAGSSAYYWSNVLTSSMNPRVSECLYFVQSEGRPSSQHRYYGVPVRAVYVE